MPHFLAYCALSEDVSFGSSPKKFQIFSGKELCIWYWKTVREECITMILTFYIESRLKVGVD